MKKFLYRHGGSYDQVRHPKVLPLCFLVYFLVTYGFTAMTRNQSIGQGTPLIIHLSDFGFMDESVEKNHSWTDGLGNKQVECILLGMDPAASQHVRFNIQVVDYQEDINPVVGYLRERGISVHQNTFQKQDLEHYLEELHELDAEQWGSELAYSSQTFDVELTSYGIPNNTIYLLSGNRAIIFRYYTKIDITQELIDSVVSIYQKGL